MEHKVLNLTSFLVSVTSHLVLAPSYSYLLPHLLPQIIGRIRILTL
jgi:hypothetical protein